MTKPTGNPRGRKPKGCGTNGGYQRHMRLGEVTCEPCKEARRVAQRAMPTPWLREQVIDHAAADETQDSR